MENNLKLLSKLKSQQKLSHLNLNLCPMCSSSKRQLWCKVDKNDFKTVQCNNCGLIYVQNPLNLTSLKLYYSEYYSQTHQKSEVLNNQRELMYKLELGFLLKFKSKGSVLDIGCSGGQFLNHFHSKGFDCEGVEFGKEAANEAMKKFKIHIGEFPKINFNKKYDVIVFRGCIEHLINPRKYFKKALSVLNKDGIIFITATQNRNSLTCKLFNDDWNMHYPHEHLIHFCPDDLINYFKNHGLKSFSEGNIYLESPYSNPINDFGLVLKKMRSPKLKIKCPPFFDNMMTLVLNF